MSSNLHLRNALDEHFPKKPLLLKFLVQLTQAVRNSHNPIYRVDRDLFTAVLLQHL